MLLLAFAHAYPFFGSNCFLFYLVRLAADPGGADGAVVAQHDGGEDRLPDVGGATGCLFNRGGRGEIQNGQVRLHPRRDIADLVFGVQRAGRADGGQPPELAGMQGLAPQLADLICGGHGVQHGKRRSAAGVSGKADAQVLRKAHVEQA